MGNLLSGTIITSAIRPSSDTSVYPVAYCSEIKGGHHQVMFVSDLDDIPRERRITGMLCTVVEDGKTYQLVGGIENSNWQIAFAQIVTPTFVINSILRDGIQPLIIKAPKSGVIKSIEAICGQVGTADLEIIIEKTSELYFETNSKWQSIFTSGNNLKILSGRTSSKSAPEYILSTNTVNAGDVFRLNLITNNCGLKGLTVHLNIECDN